MEPTEQQNTDITLVTPAPADTTVEAGQLSQRQYWVIGMIARGEEECSHLGINRKTLWRWKQIPEFNQELERVTQEMQSTIRKKVLGAMDLSLYAISKELPRYEPNIKLIQAAVSVLKSLNIDKMVK